MVPLRELRNGIFNANYLWDAHFRQTYSYNRKYLRRLNNQVFTNFINDINIRAETNEPFSKRTNNQIFVRFDD